MKQTTPILTDRIKRLASWGFFDIGISYDAEDGGAFEVYGDNECGTKRFIQTAPTAELALAMLEDVCRRYIEGGMGPEEAPGEISIGDYIVSQGIGDGQWGVYTRKPNGSLKRVVSKNLPLRMARQAVVDDLKLWLQVKKNRGVKAVHADQA